MMNLERDGFGVVPTPFTSKHLDPLRDSLIQNDAPGERCLLDHPGVRMLAISLKNHLASEGHLPANSVAIDAIAFNKTAAKNWKVPWHQDVIFPIHAGGFTDQPDLLTVKQGVSYSRPPREILEQLLAVRLHLDDCGPDNGPLRVSPGTHRLGILLSDSISNQIASHGEASAIARAGEAVLMRPLCLHASSQACKPSHRRVLHFVYHSGPAFSWHRAV